MPWEGYNYEDAILHSEELCKEDIYTSIHIEEYECDARDTKLGAEEITRELPNTGDDTLKNRRRWYIICIGAEVHPGDILVGKATPKVKLSLLQKNVYCVLSLATKNVKFVTHPCAYLMANLVKS